MGVHACWRGGERGPYMGVWVLGKQGREVGELSPGGLKIIKVKGGSCGTSSFVRVGCVCVHVCMCVCVWETEGLTGSQRATFVPLPEIGGL